MPFFMILGSAGLIGLYYLWPSWVPTAFAAFWSITFISYLFQTLFSFAIDPATARRAWLEGLAFPGLISLAVMMLSVLGLLPFAHEPGWRAWLDRPAPGGWTWANIAVHVILGWSALSTFLAWVVYRLDKAGAPRPVRNTVLMLVGYGPLLCAISLAAIIAEFRSDDLKWDKTIKTGRVRIQT
jgi:hypothetical protein